MTTYAVTLILDENKFRGAYESGWPSRSGQWTKLVKAESIADAVTKIGPGEDCLKLEIVPIYGEPVE